MSLVPYIHLPVGALRGAPAGAALDLDDDQRRHLHRVLRLQAGAEVIVADGQGRETAAVLGVGTVIVTGPIVEHAAPAPRLHLVQAMAKGRKVDEVVRSATELGVDRITIVASARSDLKPAADKVDRLLNRWRAVAKAAAEQARRPWLPVVEGPVPFDGWTKGHESPLQGVVGHPDAKRSLRATLEHVELASGGALVAAVGPEGGFTDDEIARLDEIGLQAVTLGEFVLRTEHAGHALCSVLAFYLGRMG